MSTRMPGEPPSPPTRPEHSEAYWLTMKFTIIGLAILMVPAMVLAVIVLLGVVPWTQSEMKYSGLTRRGTRGW